jgi:hypothetical protein
MKTAWFGVGLGMAAWSIVTTAAAIRADEPVSVLATDAPAPAAADETYLLRYRLSADEAVRYEVTQVAKTKTRIRGTEETAQVHTTSEKLWRVTAVAEDGSMTFEHSVDAVEMMQQTGSQEELRWSSRSGEVPPIIFETVADQLQKPLVTVTINPRGQETDREQHAGTDMQLGMGGLTLALPEEPIAVGGSWSVPREIKARDEAGQVKVIKARETYRLEKVQTGVATLQVRTEVLTPIEQASVKAQIVQQLSNGSIRFDIDAGRVLSKELDWDETVVGFQGDNSLMEYRARITERLVEGPARTAKR